MSWISSLATSVATWQTSETQGEVAVSEMNSKIEVKKKNKYMNYMNNIGYVCITYTYIVTITISIWCIYIYVYGCSLMNVHHIYHRECSVVVRTLILEDFLALSPWPLAFRPHPWPQPTDSPNMSRPSDDSHALGRGPRAFLASKAHELCLQTKCPKIFHWK